MACLGRQLQARKFQRVQKAFVLSRSRHPWVTTAVTLQCPSKTQSTSVWKKCGRRERESRREGRRDYSLRVSTPSRVVTVKDILVVWKAALFAGRRRNEDLGRSVERCGYPPASDAAPMTADVRRTPRRGTPSRMRHKAYAPDARTRNRRMCSGDASFTRSFDPCTSILTTHHDGQTSWW
jgi:hypothetical protein